MKALISRAAVSILLLTLIPSVLAQEYLDQRMLPTSDPDYHVDVFFFTAPFGIRTINAEVSINPMNQVQPGEYINGDPYRQSIV